MRLHMMSVCYAILIGLCGYPSQMETILSYAFCLKTWIINYYTQYRFTAASDHEEFLIILIIMQKKKIRNAAHKYVRNIDWNTIPTMRNALYTWLTSFSLRFFFDWKLNKQYWTLLDPDGRKRIALTVELQQNLSSMSRKEFQISTKKTGYCKS